MCQKILPLISWDLKSKGGVFFAQNFGRLRRSKSIPVGSPFENRPLRGLASKIPPLISWDLQNEGGYFLTHIPWYWWGNVSQVKFSSVLRPTQYFPREGFFSLKFFLFRVAKYWFLPAGEVGFSIRFMEGKWRVQHTVWNGLTPHYCSPKTYRAAGQRVSAFLLVFTVMSKNFGVAF